MIKKERLIRAKKQRQRHLHQSHHQKHPLFVSSSSSSFFLLAAAAVVAMAATTCVFGRATVVANGRVVSAGSGGGAAFARSSRCGAAAASTVAATAFHPVPQLSPSRRGEQQKSPPTCLRHNRSCRSDWKRRKHGLTVPFVPSSYSYSSSLPSLFWSPPPSRQSPPPLSRLLHSASKAKALEEEEEELGYLTTDEIGGDGDTIFALSSGGSVSQSGGGGAFQATAVAVVRLSGPRAGSILSQLTPTKPTLPSPRVAALRKLYSPNPKQQHEEEDDDDEGKNDKQPPKRQLLDKALVLWFPGPRSFTGENVVELHLHGSRAVVSGVLDALPMLGARPADPGEFTRRAWRGGKLDALQVEALADLLAADTRAQRVQALQQLEGDLSRVYDEWRDALTAGLAHAEAVIDFGDDEMASVDDGGMGDDDIGVDDDGGGGDKEQERVWGGVTDRMRSLRASMNRQLADHRRGELVRQGLKICLLGPPNAGKSSLFNVLAGMDAAIVSGVAGTTRDVLSVPLQLAGAKCLLQDTAGVRPAEWKANNDDDAGDEQEQKQNLNDQIEAQGIERACKAATEADLVVVLVDGTDVAAGLDNLRSVLTALAGNNNNNDGDNNSDQDPPRVMLVLNKSDLKQREEDAEMTTTPNAADLLLSGMDSSSVGGVVVTGIHDISCVTLEGMDAFLDALAENVAARLAGPSSSSSSSSPVNGGGGGGGGGGALITRARHRRHVEAAVEALVRFESLSAAGSPAVDLAAEELRLAASELGRITGAIDAEDVLDKLFADFCIGK